MTYQVLSNKWRPKNFEEVVGQNIAVTILQNSLNSQKLHHAYLFTGSRGVGKTTIARIFAKSLICEIGISANFCDNCNCCTEVNKGNCLDVIEIDAASKTKVEDTRIILDNLIYSPNKARFKIYIIDEVHMLSNHSFNALLKSLEEPPEHIKFLLATTEPQKLPITVLSRCLQLKLKLLSVSDIIKQLNKILTIEKKTIEQEGLLQIAIAANGSMRDSLSLLEQVLAFCDNLPVINYYTVIQALNLPDEIKVINLLKAVMFEDLNMVIAIIKDLFLDNCDPINILQNMQSVIKNIIILQLLIEDCKIQTNQININEINIDDILSNTNEISNKSLLMELAQLSSEEDLQLYYEIVVQGFKSLPFTPDIKVGFEMIILRMLAFKPLRSSKEELVARRLPANDSKTSKENTDHSNQILNNIINISEKENNTDINKGDINNAHINNADINSTNIKNTDIGEKEFNQEPNKAIDFLQIVEKLKVYGLTKELTINAVFESISVNIIKMIIDKEKQLMVTNKNINNLQLAFSKLLGKDIKLKVEFMDFNINPNFLKKTFKYQQQIQGKKLYNNDNDLQQLITEFNGQIENIEKLP